MGATLVNTSNQSFSIQHCRHTPFAQKPVLNDQQFEDLAKGLDRLGKVASDMGLQLVYHHHMTTTVQTADEIDHLMTLTDPRYVHLIFDSGHLAFADADPVAVLDRHFDRVRHVHLKNVRPTALAHCRDAELSFLQSIPADVFTIPGDPEGGVDFPAIFDLLDRRGYSGWLVVEAEQDPDRHNPLDCAFKAREYLRQQIGL